MGTCVLRPGRLDEAAEMLSVMTAALSADVASGAILHAYPDREQETAWLRYLLATGQGFVAEIDDRLAGFAITAQRGPVRWLVSLFVRPDAQGQGIGHLLLDRLWPPGHRTHRATLVDAASWPATSLYLHAGLTPRFPVLAFEGRIGLDRRSASGMVARDDWPEVVQRVATADAASFGAERSIDHAHWTERGLAFRSIWTASGEWLGYGRWTPSGRLGPVVLVEDADWLVALGTLAADATRTGMDRLRLMVPAVNEDALQACRTLGLRYQGMEIVMATLPLSGWNRCLIHRAGLP
jgi:GNAT superfamily N-acetyltransferase